MKKHRRAAGAVLSALLVVCLSSCGGSPPQPPPQNLSFWFSGAPGFADDLAAFYNHSIPNVRVSRELHGSVTTVTALQDGKADFGAVPADVTYLAYRRGTERAMYQHDKLRGMAVVWVSNMYIVVLRDSAFHSLGDLKGKRIGVPTPDRAGESITRVVLRAYGMEYSDVRPTLQDAGKTIQQLQAGELDAAIVFYPNLPNGRVPGLNDSVGVRALPIDNKVMNRLRATYPFLKRVLVRFTELPEEHNNGEDDKQEGTVETVGVDTLLVCRQQLSDDLVYQLTKQFFASLPELAHKYPLAAIIDPDQASTTPIPLHPGAARYYRELEIPR